MSDVSDGDSSHDCPEYGCSLSLDDNELFAHLRWEHGDGLLAAERVIEDD
jgi:hypothetical protein